MDHLYPAAKEKFLGGQLNWLTDPVVAVLVGTQYYTYSDAHATLLDLPLTARIAVTTGTLTGRTATLGVADADDASFGSVIGNMGNAIILCTDTGTDATSALIAYLDTGGGVPVNPDGSVINIAWSNGANKIFAW
jgi:hypothetical protein